MCSVRRVSLPYAPESRTCWGGSGPVALLLYVSAQRQIIQAIVITGVRG